MDILVPLKSGCLIRRALTLLRKEDGLPILLDIFEVEGGSVHDYNARVQAPPNSLVVKGPILKPRKGHLYTDHSNYPLLDFRSGGKVEAGWKATWGRGAEKVQATVLSDCTELVTYRSPGWRSQFEITSDRKKYFDTVILRNRRPKSRCIVVYEVLSGPPEISGASVREENDLVSVTVELKHNRSIQIQTPAGIVVNSEKKWKVQKSR